jgi:hypothetical protein
VAADAPATYDSGTQTIGVDVGTGATQAAAGDHEHSGTYVAVTDLTASGKGFIEHGSTAATARPTGYASVEWFGTIEPDNWIDGDTWNSP